MGRRRTSFFCSWTSKKSSCSSKKSSCSSKKSSCSSKKSSRASKNHSWTSKNHSWTSKNHSWTSKKSSCASKKSWCLSKNHSCTSKNHSLGKAIRGLRRASDQSFSMRLQRSISSGSPVCLPGESESLTTGRKSVSPLGLTSKSLMTMLRGCTPTSLVRKVPTP